MPDANTPEIPVKQSEINKKPNVLWRAFTVNPKMFSIENLSRPLFPGTSAQDDPNRMIDGNERGVYISTNRTMVEAAYAHASRGLSVEAPKYNDGYSIATKIALPQCGIVVRIDTKELAIRKPKITSVLQGVYNNGFEGDEYIIDEVPSKNYQVVKLILSRWANDSEQFTVDVPDAKPGELKAALEKIQKEFSVREQSAKKFAAFLASLNPQQRLNEIIVKREWQKYQDANKPTN
jgi:hypothetical protein